LENYPSIKKLQNTKGNYNRDHDINFKAEIAYDLDMITDKIIKENAYNLKKI